MGPLRIGLIPRPRDADEVEREFVAALGELLGREIVPHRAADYTAILTGLKLEVIDLAWLPPLVAAKGVGDGLAEPVAVAIRSGTTSYTTVLVAGPSSPLRTIADLRGLRVAWVDRGSASGYVVLRAALVRAGVKMTDAFSSETFVRSHAAVAQAVLEGRADVGATCAHIEEGTVRFAQSPYAGEGGLSSDALRVIFEAGPIPSDIFAVRRGVARAVRDAVEGALLRAQPERLHAAARRFMDADGFATPTPEHHRMLAALVPR
jgi:phosphonate transport system substrate-binding protein